MSIKKEKKSIFSYCVCVMLPYLMILRLKPWCTLLLQHVKEATHILDLVISEAVSNSDAVVKDFGISDCFRIFFEMRKRFHK